MSLLPTKKELQANSVERLHKWIKPGDTVYTTLRHVSRSGMLRAFSVAIACVYPKTKKPFIFDITHDVGLAAGIKFSARHNGLLMDGCGMDMAFQIVYDLGRTLFPDGFAPSDLAIAADHMELAGKLIDVNIGRGFKAGPFTKLEIEKLHAKGYKFIGGRNGDTSGWDNDGGYALHKRSL